MKAYRENELKYYIISCIFVFLWIHFEGVDRILELWTILEPLLISPVFYIFSILLDSLYSSDAKFRIIYWNKGMPSRTIFDKIARDGALPWFTAQEARKVYKVIYDYMPKSNDRYDYQAREWYKIYIKYRDKSIESLDIVAKEYRMFRDMNIVTINLFIIYIFYCILSQKIYWTYIVFLLIATVITNLSARNKGYRWVYNVISYDMNTHIPNSADEPQKN